MDQNLLTPREPRRQRPARRALTLIELVVVLFILVALAAIVVPMLVSTQDYAAEQTTKATLVAVRDAMIQYWQDTKYVDESLLDDDAKEEDRFRLRWLFVNPETNDTTRTFNPDTAVGWNGPYLSSVKGTLPKEDDDSPEILDSFVRNGNPDGLPIVWQIVENSPAYELRLISVGPDGEVRIDESTPTADLVGDDDEAKAKRGDDVYVAFTLR